jgi:hypothetical protein
LLVQTQRTRISARRAEALLFPIAAFLRAGGLNKNSAIEGLAAAFDRSSALAGTRRFEHIGHPTLYADIVALWGHDLRFLDKGGRPRPLPMHGKDGLRALVRKVDSKCDPHAAVRVLMRFGNVRKASTGKYRLVRPLFFTSTSNSMAFEPMAYFLSDASSTLGQILRRTPRSRGPELFWRKVESTGISSANSRQFVAFVKERGQEFLEEIDDWLEARSSKRVLARGNRKLRRVGLGFFSIDSAADLVGAD